MPPDTEPPLDLFVHYAEADFGWVDGHLAPALSEAGVRWHSEAEFALGAPRQTEIERAIRGSRRTLLVLSPDYLADGFGWMANLLAQSHGLETSTWPVIPLILRPVKLPSHLSLLTVLDATNPERWPSVLERLCAEVK